jgi:hypothetical protein
MSTPATRRSLMQSARAWLTSWPKFRAATDEATAPSPIPTTLQGGAASGIIHAAEQRRFHEEIIPIATRHRLDYLNHHSSRPMSDHPLDLTAEQIALVQRLGYTTLLGFPLRCTDSEPESAEAGFARAQQVMAKLTLAVECATAAPSVPSLPSCETKPAPRIRVVGETICWGIKDHYATAPILNLPAGVLKVRRRLRPNQPARIYLRYADRLEVWLAQDHPAGLHLKLRQGINVQDQPRGK